MVLDCTYLHELYRLISSCVVPEMVSLPNPRLNDALDSQEQSGALLPGRQRAASENSSQQDEGSHGYYGQCLCAVTCTDFDFDQWRGVSGLSALTLAQLCCRGARGTFDG